MRVRRHLPQGIDWSAFTRPLSRLVTRQHTLLALGVFVVMAIAGYATAAVLLFPAPMFAASQRVPRVIGLSSEQAEKALTEAQLKPQQPGQVRHQSYAPGTVAWQDPPPGMMVPQGTSVELSVSAGPPRIPLPDVSGHTASVARLLVESAGLTVGSIDTAQTAAPPGVVVNTRPPAGAALSAGRPVTLVVSAGAPTITVPHVLGLRLDEASIALAQSGLALGTYFRRTSGTARPETIIEQRPVAGTLAAPGTAVHVVLARQRVP